MASSEYGFTIQMTMAEFRQCFKAKNGLVSYQKKELLKNEYFDDAKVTIEVRAEVIDLECESDIDRSMDSDEFCDDSNLSDFIVSDSEELVYENTQSSV